MQYIWRAVVVCLPAVVSLALTRGTWAADAVAPAAGKPDESGTVLFYDVRPLGVEGQGWRDLAAPFDRLPGKAKGVVRDRVWDLGRQSAGLCVRFATDASAIHARWSLTEKNLAMRHMPATGVSGLDLYVKTTPDAKWRWLAVGIPQKATTTAVLAKDLPAGKREYLLYFPLYNGVSSVEIGLPKGSTLFKADPRPAEKLKPIVFYGTSITQGGCASRPGMCHTAILGRRLNRPVINLGFSGNGNMDPEVAALLAELDPAVFVIDCLPNSSPEQVAQRAGPLVKTIRARRPTTPILLVEDRTYADAFLQERKQRRHGQGRAALRKTFDALVAAGDENLTYLKGENLLAADGDSTVDGSHPTDLGFVQQADALQPALEKLLLRSGSRGGGDER